MPTQLEYNLAKSNHRKLNTKINLLNYQFLPIYELSGVVLSNSFSISCTSDIRRTGRLTLTPTDSSFDLISGNKIWLDKYIQVYIGIEDELSGKIEYTNMGIYLINNPSQVYSATDNTITLELVDLMAKMTGLRNGMLDGFFHEVKEGESIRNVIIATIGLCGFTRYIINIDSEDYQTIQYDISVDGDATVYDLLSKINDMNPNYQMYFDVDGIFHYEKIPSGYNEQVMVSDDLWKDVLIDYNKSVSYEDVKNDIIVQGKTHDISNYGGTATISGNTYVITCNNVTGLTDNLKIGFTSPSSIATPYINLNGYGSKQIKNENGTIPIIANSSTYYVVKYKKNGDYFMFMGEITPSYEIKDENPNSPFYIEGTVGSIRIVLKGGEYDNINTTDLARQRAEWELYTRCKLKDNIALSCVPIYWLDVNWLISITLPNKQGTEETNYYIIKEISIGEGITATQSIQCMKYYPYYPS